MITLNLHVMYMIMSHWIKRKTVNSPPKEKMTSGSTEAERKLPSDEVALRFPPRRLNRMVKQSMAAGYWIPVPSAVDVRVPVQNKLTTHFYIRRKLVESSLNRLFPAATTNSLLFASSHHWLCVLSNRALKEEGEKKDDSLLFAVK